MFLATGTFLEFAQFLQIVSWIILPVFALIIFFTVWLHYRRKKSKVMIEAEEKIAVVAASPIGPPAMDEPGNYLLFDHSGLLRQYRNKLSYNHARYTALKHDFEKLERKYVAVTANHLPVHQSSINTMEHTNDELISHIDRLKSEFGLEKESWNAREQELNRLYQSVEKENESLLEQLNLQSSSEDEKVIVVNRWREENLSLKEKINEQQYLADLLEEKKAEILFLHSQAEVKIKNYHRSEQQRNELLAELDLAKQQREQSLIDIDNVKNGLSNQEGLISQLQIQSEEKNRQLAEHQGLLATRSSELTWLESQVQELRQQNEMLNAAIADHEDRAIVWQQQVEEGRAKMELMQQRLQANRQVMQRLYKEFTNYIEVETGEGSPVVALRPAYVAVNNE